MLRDDDFGNVDGVPPEVLVPKFPWDPNVEDLQLAVSFLQRHDSRERICGN